MEKLDTEMNKEDKINIKSGMLYCTLIFKRAQYVMMSGREKTWECMPLGEHDYPLL